MRQGQLPSGSSEPGVCHGGIGFQAQAPAARRGAVGHQSPDQIRNLYRGPESGGFQGCGFKGFGAGVVRGLFAALWKGARGGSAALVCDARGATAVFCSNARGVQFSVPALLPEERRSFVSSSVRVQVGSLLCRSGRSEVRKCNARVPCVPPRTLEASAPAAANLAAFSVALRTVLRFPLVPGAMRGFSRVRKVARRAAMAIAPLGLGAAAAVPRAASLHPRVAAVRRPGADRTGAPAIGIAVAAPLDASAVADLQRSHGKYIYHGTDIHVVEGIVSRGLLPGGGPGGRLANHFVVGTMPTQWSDARGFRRGSNTVVQCDLEVLGRAGVRLFQGADGVLLADTVPPEAIFRILGADNKRGA